MIYKYSDAADNLKRRSAGETLMGHISSWGKLNVEAFARGEKDVDTYLHLSDSEKGEAFILLHALKPYSNSANSLALKRSQKLKGDVNFEDQSYFEITGHALSELSKVEKFNDFSALLADISADINSYRNNSLGWLTDPDQAAKAAVRALTMPSFKGKQLIEELLETEDGFGSDFAQRAAWCEREVRAGADMARIKLVFSGLPAGYYHLLLFHSSNANAFIQAHASGAIYGSLNRPEKG